jgi:hypothetical protein
MGNCGCSRLIALKTEIRLHWFSQAVEKEYSIPFSIGTGRMAGIASRLPVKRQGWPGVRNASRLPPPVSPKMNRSIRPQNDDRKRITLPVA